MSKYIAVIDQAWGQDIELLTESYFFVCVNRDEVVDQNDKQDNISMFGSISHYKKGFSY